MSLRWTSFLGLAGCGWLLATTACGPRALSKSGDDMPQDQWSQGVWQYGQHCAGCHGEDGVGSEDGPPLVGAGTLPKTPRDGSERQASFATMADVFAYAKAEMPPLSPGTVSDQNLWAILAYLAKARGADLAGADLGPETAAGIRAGD